MKFGKNRIATIVIASVLLGSVGGALGAANSKANNSSGTTFSALLAWMLGFTVDTGQPSVECGEPEAPNTPGKAAQAPGSPFNEAGKAGTVYAGEQPQNSKNPKSVSQYDAACAHVPAH